MCFSATASFLTAGLAGVVGIACLARANERRELLLAGTPLLFALQQGVEGLLWLNLPIAPGGPASAALTTLFLLFAQVIWPVYAPIAILLIEPSDRRRRLMQLCLAVGAGVGAYFFWVILTRPHGAVVLDGHIVYVTEHRLSAGLALSYLAATCLPLVLSSRLTVVILGAIVLVGSVAAYALYWEALVSVWCFFAAVASVVILGHFERARRRRVRIAGA